MLLTLKQEAFALNLFKGMSQRDAYIAAGYSTKNAPATIDSNASRMASNSKIITRYNELTQATECKDIADVKERKKILTEIARARVGDYIDGDGELDLSNNPNLKSAGLQSIRVTEIGKDILVKRKTIALHNPINAIAELNKMEHVYTEGGTTNNDNRVLNIIVTDKGVADLIRRVSERTGKLVEDNQDI